jgi:DNA-binding winged helix-turn-helix (wHTH) protein
MHQVLRNDPENPVFVQTVTGKGYRFIAALIEVGIPAEQAWVGAGLETPNTNAPLATGPKFRSAWTS